MAGKKDFIGLIRDKCAGRPYDVEEYVSRIDELIKKVYATRYKPLSDTGIGGGALQVDLETFWNYCWEALEDNGLAMKFDNASVEDDSHLKGYMRKTFENLLQDKMNALSPGFHTRMKQVYRVLVPNTLDACRMQCNCWKLIAFKEKTLKPADMDRLLPASRGLTLPKLHIPKNPDAERGPWIPDKEMEEYLVCLLEAVGGMTERVTLRSFIALQYGLHTVKQVNPSNRTDDGDGKDSTDELIEMMAFESRGFFLGPDHLLMAEELVGGMSPEMEVVYYLRTILERTINQTANELKKSIGTVHNIEKRFVNYFIDYFSQSENQPTHEEGEAVVRRVSDLILKKRGTS